MGMIAERVEKKINGDRPRATIQVPLLEKLIRSMGRMYLKEQYKVVVRLIRLRKLWHIDISNSVTTLPEVLDGYDSFLKSLKTHLADEIIKALFTMRTHWTYVTGSIFEIQNVNGVKRSRMMSAEFTSSGKEFGKVQSRNGIHGGLI
ncbi:hypothetical protein Tco_1202296 [Tanacetum coccineum]